MKNLELLKKLKSLNKDFLFVLIFAIIAVFYYDSVLDKSPLNTHIWRQTDCLSMTRSYSEGADFFKPEMNCLLADNNTTGLSVGEFPILYYCVGMIWKLFGESYLSFRLFYLLILFAGLFAFFKSLRIILKDDYWAVAISVLLFTSPVYAFYGVSFLTDAPAFSFILIALYLFLLYSQKKALRLFYCSMAFFALAGLVKTSSLIAFIFLFFILFIETLSVKSLGDKKLFKCDKHEWIGFISVTTLIFLWYCYAHFFNALHGFKYTFNNIYPIWIMNEKSFSVLINDVLNFSSLVFFNRSVLMLLLVVGIINVFLWKKIPVFAYLANLIISIGGGIYFILWAPLMGVHDYYYVALLVLFIGILIPFVWFVKTKYPYVFHGSKLKIGVAVFLLYNFIYCLSVIKLKSSAVEGEFPIVCNSQFVGLMKWTNIDSQRKWKRFISMEPYLRQIGVSKDDKVISLPDPSFNMSLFFANQKGWSNILQYNKSEDIEDLIQKGANYLFISDENLLKEPFLAPFLIDKIGSYKGVDVFKLSKNMIETKNKR